MHPHLLWSCARYWLQCPAALLGTRPVELSKGGCRNAPGPRRHILAEKATRAFQEAVAGVPARAAAPAAA
eukprot:scaffold12464_cov123-Isochrysis_galbana.AAC.2